MHKQVIRSDCTAFTTACVVVQSDGCRDIVGLLVSALAKSFSELLPSAVRQDVDMRLLIIAVVRCASCEATQVIAMRQEIGSSSLVAVGSSVHAASSTNSAPLLLIQITIGAVNSRLIPLPWKILGLEVFDVGLCIAESIVAAHTLERIKTTLDTVVWA